MRILLKSLLLGVALTAVFVLLSYTSATFNGLRAVYLLRGMVLGVLLFFGMNPHQPSDRLAAIAFFILFSIVSGLLLGLAHLIRRPSNRG